MIEAAMRELWSGVTLLTLTACGAEPNAVTNLTSSALSADAAVSDTHTNGRPAGISDCYTAASRSDPATRELWRAMHAGDYAARDRAIDGLAAASAAHPDQEQFAMLSAHANLWRAAERRSLTDLLLALPSAQTAERELERALQLCPSDQRVLAWLGPVKTMLADMTGDAQLGAEGESLLAKGIAAYPFFATFSEIILHGGAPIDSAEFGRALRATHYYWDLYKQGGCGPVPDPGCGNTAEVPHNVQGTVLYLGDVLARAQEREAALEAYRLAKTLPDWSSWAFQDVPEERIRTLDERARAARSASPLDDLESAWSSDVQCSLCHR